MSQLIAPGSLTDLQALAPSADTFACDQRWLDLLQRRYGFSMTTLTTTDATGVLTGFLPVCALSSPLTGRRVVSLPFSDVVPLVAADERSANQLVDQAIALANEHRARYLELRTGVNDALANRDDFAASAMYVRWLTPLGADTDAMFSRLKKPVQRQVRPARKLGVTVRQGQTADDVAVYHRLHLLTRTRKHGMPAQSKRYFEDLWETFGADERVKFMLAEHEGQPIAGMVLIASGSGVRYAYGASDERFLALAPNNLLMWESMVWAAEHGYTAFDMGRTALDNTGLMEFKKGWGAISEPLPYYYHPKIAGLASTSEHSWKYLALTTCWKRLPLPVADRLGGVLYKHLG